MEKHDEMKHQGNRIEEDLVSLTDLLAILWHGRGTIAAVSALSVALGLAGTLYLAKYRSEGFLQFGGPIPLMKEKSQYEKDAKEQNAGISLADYKRYAAAFGASGRFADFIRAIKLDGAAGVDNLRAAFASRDGISKMVEPIFPFTKLDAKELMEQPKEASNNVIGLRFSYEADTPENAQRLVGLLGRYTIDSIIYLIYSDALQFKHTEIMAKITKLDNEIIVTKQKLEEYQRRGASLKQIVARYPDASTQSARQLVSVTDDTARFLSPITQLMTTEVLAGEASELIFKVKREQQQSLLLREYYDRAKILLEETKSGESVLRGLEPIKESVFKNKNLDDELVKEIYNTITVSNQNAISSYLEKSRFIAGPSLPESRTTRLPTALLASLLAGIALSVLLVFCRHWWAKNRLKIGD